MRGHPLKKNDFNKCKYYERASHKDHKSDETSTKKKKTKKNCKATSSNRVPRLNCDLLPHSAPGNFRPKIIREGNGTSLGKKGRIVCLRRWRQRKKLGSAAYSEHKQWIGKKPKETGGGHKKGPRGGKTASYMRGPAETQR